MYNNLFFNQLALICLIVFSLSIEGISQNNCECKPVIGINFDDCVEKNTNSEFGVYILNKEYSTPSDEGWVRIFRDNHLLVEKYIHFDDKGFWSEVFPISIIENTRYLVEYHCQKNQCYTQKSEIQRVLPPFTVDVEPTSCAQSHDGKITLDASGSLEMFWENGDKANYKDNLEAGKYKIELRSNNGCITHQNLIVDAPQPVSMILNQYDIESTHYAKININGGKPPYNIHWIGDITQISNDVIQYNNNQTIDVKVTDSNGCKATTPFNLHFDQATSIEPKDGILKAEKSMGNGKYIYNVKKALNPNDGDIDGDGLMGSLLDVEFYYDSQMQEIISNDVLENLEYDNNNVIYANFKMGAQSISTNNLILAANALQYCLENSEACDNGDPVELIPISCSQIPTPLPTNGEYSVFRLVTLDSLVPEPSRLIGPDMDGKFYFNPLNGSGNYVIEYNVDGQTFEALFDVQALNPQFRPQNLPICNNDDIFELRANPRGGTMTGVINATSFYDVGTNRIFILDPSTLSVNTPYTFTYHYSQSNLSGLECNKTAETTIRVLTAPEITIDSEALQLCAKSEIIVNQTSNATDGSQELSYRWLLQRPGLPDSLLSQSDQLILPETLISGTYTVEVVQDNECRNRASKPIEVLSLPLVNSEVISDITCFGVSSAQVNLTVEGEVDYSDYSFIWLGNSTNVMLEGRQQSNLPADSFFITVTTPELNSDGLRCSITDTVVINSYPDIEINCSPRDTTTFCFGDFNIQRTISVRPDATLPVSFSLDNISGVYSPSNVLTNLGVSNDPDVLSRDFKIYVRDGNGCIDSCEFTIRQPAPLNCNITSGPLSCFNSGDGTATATVTGGTLPYRYRWSNGQEFGPTFDASSTIMSLSAGMYSLTVTDANDCSTVCQVLVTQPNMIIPNINPVEVCLDFDTSISANPSGGVGNYMYEWSLLDPGTTMAVDTNLTNINNATATFTTWCLKPGTVTLQLIVTDDNNCMSSATSTVTVSSCFDLALRKRVADPTKQYYPGDSVTFTIEVFNQGTVDAQNVNITDMLDENMEYRMSDNTTSITGNNTEWMTDSDNNQNIIIESLPSFTTQTVKIVLRIRDNTTSNFMINWAEISSTESIVNGRVKDDPIDRDDFIPSCVTCESTEIDDEICDEANEMAFPEECDSPDDPNDEDKKDFAIVGICQLRGIERSSTQCTTPTAVSNGISISSLRDEFIPENEPDVQLETVHATYLDAVEGRNPISNNIIFVPGNGGRNRRSGIIDGQGNLRVFANQEVEIFGRLIDNDGCTAISTLAFDFTLTPVITTNLDSRIEVVEGQEDVCISIEIDNSLQIPLEYQWQINRNGTFVDIGGAVGPEYCMSTITSDMDRNQFRVLVFDASNSDQSCATFSSAAMLDLEDEPVLVCIDIVNVSVDDACEVVITPDMILQNTRTSSRIEIRAENQLGQFVNMPLNSSHIGQMFTIHAVDIVTGNSCWGKVNIEDKLPPMITCPIDYTVSCANAAFFPPIPSFRDACDLNTTIRLVSNVLQELDCTDASGYSAVRTLTYIAQDKYGNLSAPCTFRVFYTPVNIQNTVWPAQREFSCTNSPRWDTNRNGYPDLSESGLPSIGGFPITSIAIGNPNALESKHFCKVNVTYSDVSIPLCGNTFKVAREWTVLDWCSGEIRKHTQLIAVVDNIAPSINCQSNVVHQLMATHFRCTADFVVPAPIVTDCNTTTWSVAYLVGNGESSAPTNANYITDNVSINNGVYTIADLPFGRTWIRYTVVDACDNIAYCYSAVEVQDNIKPTPICDQNTVVSLSATGDARLFAPSIDDGSHDNCSDVTLAIRRMKNNCPLSPDAKLITTFNGVRFYDFVEFCCLDQTDNNQQVELLVIDASGNMNTCMVEVDVQQKVLPTLSVPNNITVDCEAGTSPTALNSMASFVSPCDVYELDFVDVTSEGDCGERTIRRTWRVKEKSSGRVVVSRVQIINVRNLTPFNLNSIVFPENKLLINKCQEAQDFGPHNYITGGFPTWESIGCSQVAVSYKDQVFEDVDDACFKIVRHWSAIDWCTYDISNPSTIKTHQQVIKVIDTERPTPICSPITEDVIDGCSKRVTFMGNGTDSCTPAEDLSYSYIVNGGTHKNSREFSEVLSVGIHEVRWTVTDKCKNSNTCIQLINVRDIKKPTPYCITELTTVLMPSSNQVAIWAKDYNRGAQDNCSGTLRFTFGPNAPVAWNRRHFYKIQGNRSIEATEAEYLSGNAELWVPAENSSALSFNCDDIGQRELSIYVWDAAGNNDFCTVRINIQDNADNCGRSRPAFISGTVMRDNTPMPNIDLLIENEISSETQVIKTDINGIYQSESFVNEVSYNLTPFKEGDWMNGVSTLDLVLIQRHILGIQEFNSPLQLVAADVSNDKRVTAADLTELRKLILGVTTKFDKNDSWKFVIDNQESLQNPWLWPTVADFRALPNAEFNFNFKGIKIGDVNNSASVNAQENNTESRSVETHLIFENKYVRAGETVSVPITISGANYLYGLQYGFKVRDGAAFKGIQSGTLSITPQNYHSVSVDNNTHINFSYHHEKMISLNDDAVMFEWLITPEYDGMLSEFVSIDSDFTSEIVSHLTHSLPIGMRIKEERDLQVLDTDKMQVYQNSPNPFSSLTLINFYMPTDESVEISIADITGRQIQKFDFDARQGMNTVQLNKNDLGSLTGVFIVTFASTSDKQSIKMICTE